MPSVNKIGAWSWLKLKLEDYKKNQTKIAHVVWVAIILGQILCINPPGAPMIVSIHQKLVNAIVSTPH